jgi:hypothetical protein
MAGETLGTQLDTAGAERMSREQARVDYIKSVIEQNAPELRTVFIPDGTPEDMEGQVLFDATENAIKILDLHATGLSIVPVIGHEGEVKDDAALATLGWARIDRVEGSAGIIPDMYEYILTPTEQGPALVNGIRAATGSLSVEEQLAESRAAMHRSIEALRTDFHHTS